ncbi:glycoside hydrolase family 2 protein [Natrinema salifodinae]|uniref:Beta-mannosidase n=1 Tax=Natrinema salifodinae TaxID=1202768 RepID=A0A1I0Q5D8_9EURY|nr:glycoside hydrolase family 2 [Natrinema salifodinae]SEW22097.1 beta-mannosidase [Natrinema salifodinae]
MTAERGREWTGGIVTDRDGDGVPTVAEWRPVSVPGRNAAFADADRIAYRTTVPDPRDAETDRALLEVRGAYGRAEIWMNGRHLGDHDPHFVPARFEFEPLLENELLVVCERPDSFPGIHATDEVPDDLATPGIWWDVTVESRPATFVRRLEARPRLAAGGAPEPDASGTGDAETEQRRVDTRADGAGAAIDVTAEIDTTVGVDDDLTLSLRPEGFRGAASMERLAVEAPAGERTTVSTRVPIREPSLWWPQGYGPQSRYAVRAKLGDDAVERTVAFRRVERDGEELLVNGRRIRARGFTRLPGGDPRADVRRAAEANATLLRVRGHVPPTELYDACDAAGILVWQDLPATEDGGEPALDRGLDLANAIAETYGRHPSLAMVGVREVPIDPFADPLGSGLLAKLAFRYRAWRTSVDDEPARELASEIADSLPEALPVVATAGAPGTDADATRLAPGWRYLDAANVDWLLEIDTSLGAFVGEVEVGSLTDATVDPASVPGLEPALAERWADGADDVGSSQTRQARTLKATVEALRRRDCGILAAAPLRDPGAGGGTGVISSDGSEKPAYRALADAFEPVQAILDEPPASGSGIVGITLCNDTHRARRARVAWRAGDESGETTVDVDSLDRVPAGTVAIPSDAERVDIEVSLGDRTVRNRYYL